MSGYCKPCENEVEVVNGECAVCGQPVEESEMSDLVTVQISFGEDDIASIRELVEFDNDPSGILAHIVEQYEAVKSKGE